MVNVIQTCCISLVSVWTTVSWTANDGEVHQSNMLSVAIGRPRYIPTRLHAIELSWKFPRLDLYMPSLKSVLYSAHIALRRSCARMIGLRIGDRLEFRTQRGKVKILLPSNQSILSSTILTPVCSHLPLIYQSFFCYVCSRGQIVCGRPMYCLRLAMI
ncbi:hypothetical protein GGR53DRAFT_149430 [Hypoxylon sp. FL1150]|nr:hypothetical protein GGR53DRAFT_149430 [Hypoxylon sp. FL1150]